MRSARVIRSLLAAAGEVRWAVLLTGVAGAATVAAAVGLLGTGAWLIATAALQPALAEIQVAVVGVRFFGISRAVLRYLERLVAHDATLRLLARLRTWFVAVLEPLAPARLVEHTSGDLLARAVSDVAALEPLVVRCLGPFAAAALVGVGMTVFLALVADTAAIPFGLGFVLLSLLVPLIVLFRNGRVQPNLSSARARISNGMVDLVQGLPDLVAFAADADQRRRVAKAADDWRRERRSGADFDALAAGLGVLITHGTVVAVLVASIPAVRAGGLEPVMLGVVCLVALAAFEAVTGLPAAARDLHHQLIAMDRLLEVAEIPPAVVQPTAAIRPSWLVRGDSSEIRIDRLWFTYPGSADATLENLDLMIDPGERLAIVGPTGCGKSTIAALLLRTWDPQQGAIRYGGQDLRELDLEGLRRRVGLVAQRPFLFAGTIAENLRLVAPEATMRDIEDACESASMLETIKGLPDGFETDVGEHGGRLSGGQRQRLTVARALLQNPAVLILDEATSALDQATAQRVLTGIDTWMGRRTQIHITHQLMEMERYDRILVMERGRFVEMGRHADLLEDAGAYSSLWNAQEGALADHRVHPSSQVGP